MREEIRNRGVELNGAELEQVSGGAGSGEFFSIVEWKQRNCDECSNKCEESARLARILSAQEQWQQGKEGNCPKKR